MGIITKLKESLSHHDESNEFSAAHDQHVMHHEKHEIISAPAVVAVTTPHATRASMDETPIRHARPSRPVSHLDQVPEVVSEPAVALTETEEHSIPLQLEKETIVKEQHENRILSEITPVIEKHINQTEIHQIIKPMESHEDVITSDHEVNPTIVREVDQENEIQEMEHLANLTSHLSVIAGEHETVRQSSTPVHEERSFQPIEKEIIHHQHIEHIQPVITKVIHHHHTQHITQPIIEKVHVKPIVHDIQVLPTQKIDTATTTHHQLHENRDVLVSEEDNSIL